MDGSGDPEFCATGPGRGDSISALDSRRCAVNGINTIEKLSRILSYIPDVTCSGLCCYSP